MAYIPNILLTLGWLGTIFVILYLAVEQTPWWLLALIFVGRLKLDKVGP